MASTKAKIPAYEALESKIDELDQLAALCSKMFDDCASAYVSESKPIGVGKDKENTPEPVTIIDRLNHNVNSIHQHLISIKASGVMLENEIPARITGKIAVHSDECITGE